MDHLHNNMWHAQKIQTQLPKPQAPETRYPYSVSLQYNRKHICGGSLVSPNIVITAAHCTTTPTKITLGRYDLDSPDDYDYEVLDVMEKIVHPEYDSTVVENDIALLVLERDSVHPYVRLNGDENVPANGEELSVMVSWLIIDWGFILDGLASHQ